MFDIRIEPRYVVGVACYCFRWNFNTEALAEGDIVADCLCKSALDKPWRGPSDRVVREGWNGTHP